MPSETIPATAMIVHDGGSEEVTNFAHLEEFLADETTQIHVWYDEHTGDPDTVYENASIVSITASSNKKTVDGFDHESPCECPFCDGDELSVLEVTEKIYQITPGGEAMYATDGSIDGPVINVYCTSCHNYLYRHPVNDALSLE